MGSMHPNPVHLFRENEKKVGDAKEEEKVNQIQSAEKSKSSEKYQSKS